MRKSHWEFLHQYASARAALTKREFRVILVTIDCKLNVFGFRSFV